MSNLNRSQVLDLSRLHLAMAKLASALGVELDPKKPDHELLEQLAERAGARRCHRAIPMLSKRGSDAYYAEKGYGKLTLRLTHDTLAALDTLATARKLPRSAVLSELIRDARIQLLTDSRVK